MASLKKILFILLGFLVLSPSLSLALKPAPGVLLQAKEHMVDPRFQETVILLIRHDDQGSLGLILNRPTRFTLEQTFPQVEVFDNLDQLLWLGGPVATGSALVLLQSRQPPEGVKTIFNGVHVTGIRQLIFWLGQMGGDDRYRVYAGYAGWAAGQLDSEMRRGDWQLRAADPATIFGHPGKMWDRQESLPGPMLIKREERRFRAEDWLNIKSLSHG